MMLYEYTTSCKSSIWYCMRCNDNIWCICVWWVYDVCHIWCYMSAEWYMLQMTFVWYGEWMIHNDVYMRHVKRMTSNVFVYDRWVRMMCVCNTWMNVYEKFTYDVEWCRMTSNCSSGRNDPFFGKKRHFFHTNITHSLHKRTTQSLHKHNTIVTQLYYYTAQNTIITQESITHEVNKA